MKNKNVRNQSKNGRNQSKNVRNQSKKGKNNYSKKSFKNVKIKGGTNTTAELLDGDLMRVNTNIQLYITISSPDIETIIDDTDENLSSKIKKMNLIGSPFQIIIGKKTENGLIEFKRPGDELSLDLPLEDVIKIIKEEKAKY